jgi:hypothetical protein
MNSRPSTPLNDVIVGVRNMVSLSRIIRQSYAFTPTQQGAPRAKLKVEVNCSEHKPVYEIVTIPFDTGSGVVDLRTYDIDEMLGTKMRALFQRDQSRDLFDLNRALTDSTPLYRPDPDRIVFAFRKYMKDEGSKVGSDSISMKFADRIALFSKRNQRHANQFSDFCSRPRGSDCRKRGATRRFHPCNRSGRCPSGELSSVWIAFATRSQPVCS